MADPIVERIVRTLGAPDLVGRLAALPGSDLQSLLLAVTRARAAAVTPAQLATARGGTALPSSVDARRFHALDGAAYAAADGFEAVELAPVVPLGTDTRLGGISANNVLATVRGSQLTADPTTALALEAARRRRDPQARADDLKLCASARVVRLQPLPPGEPHFSPHFRLFSLLTAGRDAGNHAFEVRALREQLAVYLRLVDLLAAPALGVDVRAIEVAISDTDAMRALLAAAGVPADELAGLVHGYDADAGAPALASRGLRLPRALDPDRDLAGAASSADPAIAAAARAARRRLAAAAQGVIAPLARDFPRARFRLDGARLAGLGYYAGLTIQLWLETADGASLPVGDGGFTTWTRDLLADRKERLLTSGLGVELLLKRYRR